MSKSVVIKHRRGYLSTCPIGSIIAWHRDLMSDDDKKLKLPIGWVTCNGQTIDDPESPFYNHLIHDLNGEGRFLRGAKKSGAPQPQDWKSFSAMSERKDYIHGPVSVPKQGYSTPYLFGGHWEAVREGGKLVASGLKFKYDASEVRPINMSVIWIMKIK